MSEQFGMWMEFLGIIFHDCYCVALCDEDSGGDRQSERNKSNTNGKSKMIVKFWNDSNQKCQSDVDLNLCDFAWHSAFGNLPSSFALNAPELKRCRQKISLWIMLTYLTFKYSARQKCLRLPPMRWAYCLSVNFLLKNANVSIPKNKL